MAIKTESEQASESRNKIKSRLQLYCLQNCFILLPKYSWLYVFGVMCWCFVPASMQKQMMLHSTSDEWSCVCCTVWDKAQTRVLHGSSNGDIAAVSHRFPAGVVMNSSISTVGMGIG